MPKLTKRVVDAQRAGERRLYVFDSTLPGFGLKVYSSGVRSFFVQYRVRPGGPPRRVTLGRYGVLTVEQARVRARKILGKLDPDAGTDPVADQRRQGVTVNALADRFLAEHAEIHEKPKTPREDRRMLDKIIRPRLGRKRVVDVTHDHVARLHRSLRETPIQANRCVSLLRRVFNLAERWELRPEGTNPTRHVRWFKEKRRERFLSPEELARLGEALRAEAEKPRADRRKLAQVRGSVEAIRLLILTGCRVNEVLSLRWEHVDFRGAALRLPDSKTGQKAVPLGAPALEALDRLRKRNGSEFVFPGNSGGPRKEIRRVWDDVRGAAGLEDLRLHDLRHSYASVAASAGFSLVLIGKILGHASEKR